MSSVFVPNGRCQLAYATDWTLSGLPLGVIGFACGWAFVNAVLFTLYIVLAHRISRVDAATSPIDRLGASMIIASLAITPLGLMGAAEAFGDPVALLAGVGVGISSSVIPYVFDQFAMSRLPRATYAMFVALLPATAVIIGVIVLAQIPTLIEVAAVVLVIVGVAIHRESREDQSEERIPVPDY